jgi:RimJ/RimL family protein N-acetyltransferase
LAALILVWPAAAVTAAEIGRGTYFKYDYLQRIDGGTGEYQDWNDETKGTGHYEVLSWGPGEAVMRARQSWTYRNDDGKRDSGDMDRTFSFSLQTRLYTSNLTDLDDPPYNTMTPSRLGQWLWVPPDIDLGEKVWILDENWTVTGKDVVLWSKLVPRRLIEVTSYGDDSRDDDYGQFSYTYTDRLYFDKATGMFFAERYEERDSGSFEGNPAGFRYTIEIDVTESSYAVDTDWPLFGLFVGGVALLLAAVIGGIGYGIHRARWARRTVCIEVPDGAGGPGQPPGGAALPPAQAVDEVDITRLWRIRDFPHIDASQVTDLFGPFLEHWAEKALWAKDPVAVAVTADGSHMMGIAYYNREARIGTVLARNSELAETMRAFVRAKDFFTENRHTVNAVAGDQEMMDQLARTGNEAYNVFETHKVYRLDGIRPASYDVGLVRPMTADDLPAAAELAERVWRHPSKKWLRSCLESGDLAYVAVADGRLVGFGFACVSGEYGRLHTLAVDEAYRMRGIGKELHRARLESMRLLGVRTVFDEIADWNLASIRISALSGFQPVGRMFVETVRTERIKMDIVRRW